MSRTFTYPVELPAPDILPYKNGNCGVPYVHSFPGNNPGPHVMITALVHGNEIAGALALDWLMKTGFSIESGRLTLAFMNVGAFERYDNTSPDAYRFVDEDMNRVWSAERLARSTLEAQRAAEIEPLLGDVDFLLDLHSMHEPCAPLALSGPLEKNIKFARQFGVIENIIVDKGHPEGTRLRDYAHFGLPWTGSRSLLVECGHHTARSSFDIARLCISRILRMTGIGRLACDSLSAALPMPVDQKVIHVTHPVVASDKDFSFVDDYKGLERIDRAGTVIGFDGSKPVVTPYDDCFLVMPSLRQAKQGVTVVRFGTRDPAVAHGFSG